MASTTQAKIREAQLRAAMGLGGPRQLADHERAEGAGDRAEIESALAGLLPDVTGPATIEEPLHDPRNPMHEKIRTAYWDYAGAEKNFLEDNPDAASRL
jgi:hypothetical protein